MGAVSVTSLNFLDRQGVLLENPLLPSSTRIYIITRASAIIYSNLSPQGTSRSFAVTPAA